MEISCSIEILLKGDSEVDHTTLKAEFLKHLKTLTKTLQQNSTIPLANFKNNHLLFDNIETAKVCEIIYKDQSFFYITDLKIECFVYKLNDLNDEDQDEDEEMDGVDDGGIVQFRQESLPSSKFEGLWESLIFVLLHGPPGTGKTSLCKALAQKLSIRLAEHFPYGKFIEINSHSLFSKYFSESGKLVGKLFSDINQFLDDESTFICLLIDEVESLTSARKQCLNGMEPSDSIRVVNALLTQLDQLKNRKNVCVFTTSNLTNAIDDAFIDRADVMQFIGNPSKKAIYIILSSCLNELIRCGLIFSNKQKAILDYKIVENLKNNIEKNNVNSFCVNESSISLFEISTELETRNFSGRSIRKLPFLTHAYSFNVS
ncbi:Pachytene checkpoint protein 2 [Clydaea vesicula]|uniref:Pachytene checkpoint protein 2 n=1 Tax=Clydaea vesicula TaxID=447962 RepID=A0AAD5TT32_9FUNG|nr:Pachytene checkpoint protein 2 [Clydaea vesicula]